MKKSLLKTVNCAYLYRDGHLVLLHHKEDRQTKQSIFWVTLHKTGGLTRKWYFDQSSKSGSQFSRLVFHDASAFLPVIALADYLHFFSPVNSKGPTIIMCHINGSFLPLGQGITWQDDQEYSGTWEDHKDMKYWGYADYPITQVFEA